MSQIINTNSNSSINENEQNQYPHSQPINNNINQILEDPYKNNNLFQKGEDKENDNDPIYEIIFNAISNVSTSEKPKDIQIKIIRIITKLFENIIESEMKTEDSEKYRRIRISNPNISLMFEIPGNYELFKILGFEEIFFKDDLYLYLPKNNINIPKFQKILSYIEILLMNLIIMNVMKKIIKLIFQEWILRIIIIIYIGEQRIV